MDKGKNSIFGLRLFIRVFFHAAWPCLIKEENFE